MVYKDYKIFLQYKRMVQRGMHCQTHYNIPYGTEYMNMFNLATISLITYGTY